MTGAYPIPSPPYAQGTGLPWDVTVDDAVAAIAAARARHGDTFVVESGREHYLFTFSPTGVESFYALTEETASKAVADYLMLDFERLVRAFDTLDGSEGQMRSYLSPMTRAHASRTIMSASTAVTVSLVCAASCVCHAASDGGLLNM